MGREPNEHGKRCCFFSCWSWCRVNKISTDYPFKTPRIIEDQRSRLAVSRNQYEEQSILSKPLPLYLKGYFREKQTNQSSTLTILSRIPKPWDSPWSMENPSSVLAAQVPHPSIDLISYLICCWFNGYRMLYRESRTVWLSLLLNSVCVDNVNQPSINTVAAHVFQYFNLYTFSLCK